MLYKEDRRPKNGYTGYSKTGCRTNISHTQLRRMAPAHTHAVIWWLVCTSEITTHANIHTSQLITMRRAQLYHRTFGPNQYTQNPHTLAHTHARFLCNASTRSLSAAHDSRPCRSTGDSSLCQATPGQASQSVTTRERRRTGHIAQYLTRVIECVCVCVHQLFNTFFVITLRAVHGSHRRWSSRCWWLTHKHTHTHNHTRRSAHAYMCVRSGVSGVVVMRALCVNNIQRMCSVRTKGEQ